MNPFNGGLVSTAAAIVLVMLSVSLLLALGRLVKGPGLPDRVVALDLMGTIAVGVIAAYCVVTGESAILDAALVVALIGFLGTVAFASYLERGGPR